MLSVVEALFAVIPPFGLAESGTATSFPSKEGAVEAARGFFVMAFGSNFPVYEGASTSLGAAMGDCGEPTAGDNPDLLSISSKILRAPPEAASSLCFRSRSAACFCFQASNFASLSTFFSSSV